jgi:hypothetical protein
MLKRLTFKLFTLVMLCAALATVSSVPAATSVYCVDAPVEMGCASGLFCCVEYNRECSCA